MNSPFSFVCMSDAGFVRWLELCMAAIVRTHPGARILVFDLSAASSDAVRELVGQTPGAEHVDWDESRWPSPAWIDTSDFAFYWPDYGWRDEVKYWSRRLRARVTGRVKAGWMTDKASFVAQIRRATRRVAQKPYILRRALELAKKDLAFIDADAMVLKPLGEVFRHSFDLGVTVEQPEDVYIGPEPATMPWRPVLPVRLLNTGVVFIRDTAGAQALLDDWIEAMARVHHATAEQLALAHMLLAEIPDLVCAEHTVRPFPAPPAHKRGDVLVLPMREYNFVHVPLDAQRMPDVHVAHFAGSRKRRREDVEALIRRTAGASADAYLTEGTKDRRVG